MNTYNLSQNYQKLLDYLKENDYCKSHISWVKKCIKAVLVDGANPKIKSYEQLYWYEVNKWQYKEGASCRQSFKTTLCCVKQFDLEGKYPNRRRRSRLEEKPEKYHLLCNEFKKMIDSYEIWASTTSKREHTIHVEKRAAICFFTHLQERNRYSVISTNRNDVISFFYDGEKPLRGRAYISKIMPILKHAAINNTDVIKIIDYIPNIPKSYPNYPYLQPDEASKIVEVLRDENANCSLLDKAIVTLAYYIGMRGTDISALTIDNIDWENDLINLTQSKTDVELSIPLTATVGNAIWKYITMERQKGNSKEIFISKKRPSQKINHLWGHIKKVFNEAKVRTDGSRTGVRIFRHHLATSLLANDVASPIISSLLGHTSPESLNPYVDADIEHLRECALNVSDYPIAEEVFDL